MKKRILLIGYNYHPEPTGIGKYSGEMLVWLAQNGYDCEVITSYPYYPQWKVQDAYAGKKNRFSSESQSVAGGEIRVHRCPMYVPAVPSGLKRMLLDLSFLISAFLKLFQLILFSKKFDYVITVVPSFQIGLLGVMYKVLRKAVLLYHIQDLQIEAARDLKMIKSEKVINMLFRLEKYIFNKADVISSISEGMVDKVRVKAQKEVLLFPNWTDCESFYPITNRGRLKEEFGFKSSDKIVLYSGAIGEKQGLEAILHAAKALKPQKNLKFLICGSGPYKKKLCQLADELSLENVVFYPLQPIEKFNHFLNMADVHLVIQKSSAGDLVMPSKLTTVLGVGGLALITAHKGTTLHSYVSKHKMGLLIEPENQEALNTALWHAVSEDNEALRQSARTYAEEFLSKQKIMEAYDKKVLKGGLEPKALPAAAAKAVPVSSVSLRELRTANR
ncbi:WcaI family glycosyltransferase [Pontibacter harenae]|uniref:WcaI family glycosyltransferase n=1 Tax=Pontibacter harenae TaxID=2894083 RepID=UPI001E3C76E5|nr:WcaI family glycosyltransferase [Pontibacter harenae]MCC9167213.1 WcaI family glycosyltransferase [Pontibacter harenae]